MEGIENKTWKGREKKEEKQKKVIKRATVFGPLLLV